MAVSAPEGVDEAVAVSQTTRNASVQGLPRKRKVRDALTRREWAAIAGMAGLIFALTLVGWGTLLLIVAPHH
ncbi:MAG: hypothetical protein ACXV5Q_04955, partial [Frankiaceae bacterium]